MLDMTGGLDPTPPDPGLLAGAAQLLLALSAVLATIRAGHAASGLPPMASTSRSRGTGAVALGLVILSVAALAGGALSAPLHGGSYTGWLRVAFHGSEACYLADRAVLAWLSWQIVAGKSGKGMLRPILLPFASSLGFMVFGYPGLLRGDTLRLFYLGAELAALLAWAGASGGAMIAGWRRRPHLDELRPEAAQVLGGLPFRSPLAGALAAVVGTPERTVVTILGAGNIVLLFVGAFGRGRTFFQAYHVQQAGLVAVWGVVALVLARDLAHHARRGR